MFRKKLTILGCPVVSPLHVYTKAKQNLRYGISFIQLSTVPQSLSALCEYHIVQCYSVHPRVLESLQWLLLCLCPRT